MKEILTVLLIGLVLVSCRNDDENSNAILGTWQAQSLYKIKDGTTEKIDATNDDLCMLRNTYIFHSNGIAEASKFESTYSGGCFQYYGGSVDYTFDYKRSILSIESDGRKQNIELINFSAKEFTLNSMKINDYKYYTKFVKIN